MNKVLLIGRITKDPELKKTSNDNSFLQFTLAVNKNFKNANGEIDVDFISCIAWQQTAEIISKYVNKGQQLCLEGSLQVRSYENNNNETKYITEVLVDKVEFIGNKKEEEKPQPKQQTKNTYTKSYKK